MARGRGDGTGPGPSPAPGPLPAPAGPRLRPPLPAPPLPGILHDHPGAVQHLPHAVRLLPAGRPAELLPPGKQLLDQRRDHVSRLRAGGFQPHPDLDHQLPEQLPRLRDQLRRLQVLLRLPDQAVDLQQGVGGVPGVASLQSPQKAPLQPVHPGPEPARLARPARRGVRLRGLPGVIARAGRSVRGKRPEQPQGTPFPLSTDLLPPVPAQGHLPDPPHAGLVPPEVQDAGRVFVHAQDPDLPGQQGLQAAEARLPHEAEARVEGAPLRVVPVGHHHQGEAEPAQQVDPVGPERVLTHLVDLVHRETEPSHGEGRGAGRGEAASLHDPPFQDLRDGRVPPLPERVGGAAGSHQDVVGGLQGPERPSQIEPGQVGPRPVGDHLQRVQHLAAEILQDPPGDVVRVQLESGRRVQEHGPGALPQPGQQVLVNLNHGGGQLPRPHDGQGAAGRIETGWMFRQGCTHLRPRRGLRFARSLSRGFPARPRKRAPRGTPRNRSTPASCPPGRRPGNGRAPGRRSLPPRTSCAAGNAEDRCSSPPAPG